jgi:hypothetical protein
VYFLSSLRLFDACRICAGFVQDLHAQQTLGKLRINKFNLAMQINERLKQEVKSHPFPLLFATVSGAHLYGFPSPDSDYDLRGAHILPVRERGVMRRIKITSP